jgi:hypothetical protein
MNAPTEPTIITTAKYNALKVYGRLQQHSHELSRHDDRHVNMHSQSKRGRYMNQKETSSIYAKLGTYLFDGRKLPWYGHVVQNC